MIKEYKLIDSDIIFEYFLDTVLWIQKYGRAEIPRCESSDKSEANKLIYSFLNNGIGLLEKAYTDSVFDIMISSEFCEKYDECRDRLEKNTLILIYNLLKYMYDDDVLSFMKTSNLWSDKVKQYGYIHVYSELNDINKKLFNDFI